MPSWKPSMPGRALTTQPAPAVFGADAAAGDAVAPNGAQAHDEPEDSRADSPEDSVAIEALPASAGPVGPAMSCDCCWRCQPSSGPSY